MIDGTIPAELYPAMQAIVAARAEEIHLQLLAAQAKEVTDRAVQQYFEAQLALLRSRMTEANKAVCTFCESEVDADTIETICAIRRWVKSGMDEGVVRTAPYYMEVCPSCLQQIRSEMVADEGDNCGYIAIHPARTMRGERQAKIKGHWAGFRYWGSPSRDSYVHWVFVAWERWNIGQQVKRLNDGIYIGGFKFMA